MKRFVVCILFVAFCIYGFCVADENTGLGKDFMVYIVAPTVTQDYGITVSYSDIQCRADKGYVSYYFAENYITMRIDVDDASREITRVEISGSTIYAQFEDDYAEIFGFFIGRICRAADENSEFSLDRLGVSASDIDDAIESDTELCSSWNDGLITYEFRITNQYPQNSEMVFAISTQPDIGSGFDNAKVSAQKVLECFLENDALNIGVSIVYDESDPNGVIGTDGAYASKATFVDLGVSINDQTSTIEVSDGGSIEVFASEKDAIARERRIRDVTYFYANEREQIFLIGNVVLRLSGKMSADATAQYVGTLITMIQA